MRVCAQVVNKIQWFMIHAWVRTRTSFAFSGNSLTAQPFSSSSKIVQLSTMILLAVCRRKHITFDNSNYDLLKLSFVWRFSLRLFKTSHIVCNSTVIDAFEWAVQSRTYGYYYVGNVCIKTFFSIFFVFWFHCFQKGWIQKLTEYWSR